MKTPSSANGSDSGSSLQTRELPFGYVYVTTNCLNGKMYVGKNAKSRGVFNPRYLGSGTHLRRSIEKNGRGCFSTRPLRFAYCESELLFLERYAIALYRRRYGRNRLYNITDGGDGTSGNTHSQESREKIRASATGRRQTEAAKERLRLFFTGRAPSNKGSRMSDAQRENLRRVNSGKVHSDSTLEKMRDAYAKNPHSSSARAKMSSASSGASRTAEWREKISRSLAGHSVSEESRRKMAERACRPWSQERKDKANATRAAKKKALQISDATN